MTGDVQQQYHVTRFETFNHALPVLDFGNTPQPYSGPKRGAFCCQMFIHSLMSAHLMIYRPANLLAGVHSINRIWPTQTPIKLKTIEYVISACNGDGKTILTENFRHKFYGTVMLLLSAELRSADGPLFKRFALNHLLDTDKFAGINGIQFVA